MAIARTWPLLFLACLLPAPSVRAAGPETAELTILHTNDTHGHLVPFRHPSTARSGPGLETLPTGVELGGIARRATLVKRVRAELEPRGVPVWLVDVGDFTDGTVFSTEYHGLADIEAMGAAGYTLAALGNHELNQPLSRLKQLLAAAPFPVLCANAVEAATGRPLATPALVKHTGTLRIGLFGLLTHDAYDYPAAREGLTIATELLTARRVAQELRSLRSQADIVIALSHAGRVLDEQIAAEVPEIDVIVGGHSHSRLPSGELIWRAASLAVDDVGGAVVVQAHQWGGELGRLDLLFTKGPDGRWRVSRYRASLLPVSADLPEDAAVAAVVEKYWRPIATRFGEVIGEATADFASQGYDQADYNLMADAMRESLGTRVHLENQGGVRSPLAKGPITQADLIAMDPFENTLVTFPIKGADLARLLAIHTPAVSGLRYRVEDGKLTEALVDGRRLAPGRVYSASTNSYFARKLLATSPGLTFTETGRSRRDTFVAYVRARGRINPAYDGRRVVIEP